MSKIVLFLILLGILFLPACDPLGSDDPAQMDSHFELTIEGEFTQYLQGRASFGTFADPLTNMTGVILVLIPTPDDQRRINIAGLTSPDLEERTYLMVISEPGRPFDTLRENEFTGWYSHNDPEYSETFHAQIGEISFTTVTQNVVRGTVLFDAKGNRYVKDGEEMTHTVEVWITLQGTFTAVRGELI